MPATVTIAAGATSAPVTVTGVAPGGPVTITASVPGIATPATAMVTVSALPSVNVPVHYFREPGPDRNLYRDSVAGRAAGGVTVTLTSSDTSKVTIPASVFIAAGATTPASQPQVTAVGIGSSTITAAATGYTSGTGAVNVPAPTLNFSPPTLSITTGNTGTLTLNLAGGAAPAGGFTVNLTSSNTAVATVPATATIAAGADSVPVTVTGVAPGGPVTISASAPGIATPATDRHHGGQPDHQRSTQHLGQPGQRPRDVQHQSVAGRSGGRRHRYPDQ